MKQKIRLLPCYLTPIVYIYKLSIPTMWGLLVQVIVLSSMIVLTIGGCARSTHKIRFREKEGKYAQDHCHQWEDAASFQQEGNGCSECRGRTSAYHPALFLSPVIGGIGCALPCLCLSEPFLKCFLIISLFVTHPFLYQTFTFDLYISWRKSLYLLSYWFLSHSLIHSLY